MRILIDFSRLTADGAGGGIKQALFGLVHSLTQGAHGRTINLVLLPNTDTHHEVKALARPGDTVLVDHGLPRDIAARLNCDLVYCSFGTTDFACPGIPTIVLIVDLLHRDSPGGLPEPEQIFREQQMQSALRIADCFHVISDFTASRLQVCYGVPVSKIVRTYLPLHEQRLQQVVPARANQPSIGKGFLYPANLWGHKNHETLLTAYARYQRAAGRHCWPLILTGYIHQSRGEVLRELGRSLGIENHLIWAGYLSDADLAALYAEAGALVFPSLYEGFGLPLVEAMAAGLPILASNAAAIPEVTGDAALLVDARDPDALADGLAKIADDPNLRSRLIDAGRRRLSHFQPDREFSRLYNALVTVAARPAQCRHSGYYPIDGLTEPLAQFALPPTGGELHLTLETRPLPAPRTLQLLCGSTLLTEVGIPAGSPARVRCSFVPESRLLTLSVPDATRLCPTDPRTHGILLQTLAIETAGGVRSDAISGVSQTGSLA